MTTRQPTEFGLPSDHGGKDLGVFLPIASGGWILSSTMPTLDGSYDYNRAATLLAAPRALRTMRITARIVRPRGSAALSAWRRTPSGEPT